LLHLPQGSVALLCFSEQLSAAAISIARVDLPLPDGPPIRNAWGRVPDSIARPKRSLVSPLPISLGKYILTHITSLYLIGLKYPLTFKHITPIQYFIIYYLKSQWKEQKNAP
jgi:hypothetical protein